MFRSTRSRESIGRTEFRYAVAFEGSNLERLLEEVYDLIFNRPPYSGSWWSSRIHAAKSGDALMCRTQAKFTRIAETQAKYMTGELNEAFRKIKIVFK